MVLLEPFLVPLFATGFLVPIKRILILSTRRLVFIHRAVILTTIYVWFTYVWNSAHISDIVGVDSLNVEVLMPSDDEVPSGER
jgi:hypothetical protein